MQKGTTLPVDGWRVVAAAALIVLSGLALSRCTSRASSAHPDLKPVVTVKELMELEYWYPGDKKIVLEDEKKRATMPTTKK